MSHQNKVWVTMSILFKSNPRYQQAVAVADNPRAYFQQLQAAGYATDPNYAQKILSVFNSDTFKQARNLLTNSKVD